MTGLLWTLGGGGLCTDGAGGMLLFGGYRPGFGIGGGQPVVLNQTWQVDANAAGDLHFTLLAAAMAPSPRQALNMVHSNQGVLLFGGTNVNWSIPYGDTWLWNGVTWSSVPGISPPARYLHAMAFDSVRSVVVLFGGANSTTSTLNDTWEFDGTAWRQRSPAHQPPPRSNAACSFSPALGRVVVVGGGAPNGTGNLSDCWAWDGVDWQRLLPVTSAPAARQGSAMVFEPASQQMLLFGGRNQATSTHFNDTFRLDAPSSAASYTPFGAGCIGPTNQIPVLAAQASEAPRLGTTSHLVVSNLPVALTVPIFVLGTSNTFEPGPPGHPLPFDLGVLGWPGCQQLVSHQVFVLYQPTGAAVSNALTGVVGF